MKNIKLRTKLFIIVMIAIIPMTILDSFMIVHQRQQVVIQEQQANRDYAEAINVAFLNYLESIWDGELAMGLHIIESHAADAVKINTYLKKCIADYPTCRSLLFCDPKGHTLYLTNPKAKDINVVDSQYYNRIVNGEEKVVSDIGIGKVSKVPTITVARGIRENGELKGIVYANIDVDKLDLILPQNRLGKSSTFGVTDRNGMIVFRLGSPNLLMDKRKVSEDSPIWKSLSGEISYSTRYRGAIDGQWRLGVSIPISKIGWSSYASVSTKEVLAKANAEAITSIIVTVLIILTSLAVVLYFIIDLLKPIKTLQLAANQIASANFSVRIDLQRKDELGQTASAFNKMAEAIEQYDKLKTQFFSNLSHELKTPLNVIYATSQLLSTQYDKLDFDEYKAEVKKYMQITKQNCYRLLRLISNLIDITRYDSGYLKLELSNCNIVYLVEEITISVAKYAESNGIDIVFDTEIEEKIIACDHDFIERITLNLLSNAIKFTNKDGNIFVNVYDKQDSIVISIKDTGIGIPDDKLDVIFERFGQVDTSLSRNNEGSGIGLSLVKALVEAHKGTISVKSKLYEGTEFIIKLPANILEEKKEGITSNNPVISSNNIVERVNIELSDIYSK